MSDPNLSPEPPSPSPSAPRLPPPELATVAATDNPNPADAVSSAHLEALTVEEPAGTAGAGTGVAAAPVPATLTRDQFHGAFCAMFGLGEKLTGINGLAISDSEAKDAKAASDAIYDTACEVPWLRFLIEPSNVWLQRALVVGVFGYGKYRVVTAALAARNSPAGARKPAGEGAAPANPLHAFPPDAKAA